VLKRPGAAPLWFSRVRVLTLRRRGSPDNEPLSSSQTPAQVSHTNSFNAFHVPFTTQFSPFPSYYLTI
jgi:hypothetical protein